MKRWITYQKERFPLLGYIPMMAAFGFAGVSYSLHLYNPDVTVSDINAFLYISAGLITLIFFMLMRIADEHKDFEEDSKYRPYRPVQRGLVKLKELRLIGIFLIIVQITLTVLVDVRLLFVLLAAYVWLLLMTFEFGAAKWLKTKHTLYLLSHMAIMIFINFFVTSMEWIPRGGMFGFALTAYLISGFCDGTVVEVGRKLRAPEHEEYGVDTYTQIWGPKRAMIVWSICLSTSFITTIYAGFQVKAGFVIMAVLIPLYILAIINVVRFAKNSTPKNAKFFTVFPGVWMFLMYIMLGFVPFFV